jgi:hypothetical protein
MGDEGVGYLEVLFLGVEKDEFSEETFEVVTREFVDG